MSFPVALSKFAAPALPTTLLHREALIARLRERISPEEGSARDGGQPYKLVLLCAPAGYGKTTLLADFAQSTSVPCCWYFLDQNDTDRYSFLSGLLVSIRHQFPGFGSALDAALKLLGETSSRMCEDDSRRGEAWIDAFVAALEREISPHVALLLCNYHEVDESQSITNLVNYLLRHLPSCCTLVIESRSTPSIEFASLLAHQQAAGLGSHLLRITAREILALACVQGVAPPDETEAGQLAAAFDGWIAGILLGTRLGDAELLHASTRTAILQGLPSMRVERQKLFAYLVNEIFQRQPALYAFLKEAAILQQMTPIQCDALLDIANSSEYLARLARLGMFVTCSDGPQPLYICHPILRELLCEELHQQSPERFRELHRRAAELFEASHEYGSAITHALAADDVHKVVHLIIQVYEQTSTKERPEMLLRWLDTLPLEIMDSYPQLFLVRASVYLWRGEYYQALPLLDSASVALLQSNLQIMMDAHDLSRLQAEMMILRSKALFQAGQYQEAQHLCQQVLDTVPIDEVAMRAEAHTRFSICANLLGDITTAIEHLQKALQLWGRHTVQLQTADAHSVLATAYNMLGNFALAEHHIACAINLCEQLNDDKGKIYNLVRMAIYKQRQGIASEAETILTQALATVRHQPSFVREEAYVLTNLGSVYQDEGHYEQSLRSLEDGLGLARQLRDNYLVNCCLCYMAMTYLLMDDAFTAQLLLSETNLPPMNGEKIGYERAIHDLTHGSVLLQQKNYDAAYAFLTSLESSLQMAGLKRELLRVKVCLAACQLARKKLDETQHYLNEIVQILEHQDYGQLVHVALQRYHALYQFVRTRSDLEQLRTLLHREMPVKGEKARVTPTSLAKPILATHMESSQSKLKVQAFGDPAVFLNERPITRWRMARAMELFFFLLDCGRPVRKEQIITALWSQVDDQINQTFHSTIHYLRKALGESFVTSQGSTYSLHLTSFDGDSLEYDVASFKEHYSQAKQFLACQNDLEAKTSLFAMIELYQGDYVQPFYNDWCTFRRDELRRGYLEARSHLAHIAWRQEIFDESAVHWQYMLEMDNWIEEAHYGLMRYYMRTGKRGLALRQYQRCVETLQQELGAEPGQAIQNFYQRIISTSPTEAAKKSGKPVPLLNKIVRN